MADENELHVYGMADQGNRPPPAAQGMRGAKASTRPRERDPDFSHPLVLDNGKAVEVSEGSGVSFAEATGRAGFASDTQRSAAADQRPGNSNAAPMLIGLALAFGIAAGAATRAWLLRRPV